MEALLRHYYGGIMVVSGGLLFRDSCLWNYGIIWGFVRFVVKITAKGLLDPDAGGFYLCFICQKVCWYHWKGLYL